jgi:ABC-type branched-subunit amino acid transport system substrate-binding protein
MKVLPSRYTSKIQSTLSCLALLAALTLSLPLVRRVVAGVHVSTSLPAQEAAGALTPQERRGKQIYVQGTSASGREILAYLGDASLEVPGSAMACANCHGLNGEGKPEGGVRPSNLTWEALTKPYGVTHPGGRTHPPYTERAIELALVRGLDPAGNRLLNVMPRYQMSREDMADLTAYLKRLGRERDPGVSENSITVGTLVPAKGELAGIGQAIKAVLAAYFNEVNSQGGIYNRKIEFKSIETADTPDATAAEVRRFVQDEHVFALAGAFTAGADKQVAALMNELEVPTIGPFTLYPQVGYPLNRHVFYLLSGIEQQSRALVNFASRQFKDQKSGVLVVYPEGESSVAITEAIKDQCQKSACGQLLTYGYGRGNFDATALVARLSEAKKDAVFFLGTSEEALVLMREADKLRWSPSIYLQVTAGAGLFEAPPSFNRKIFLPFATSPADQTAEGVKEFRALAAEYNLPAHHLAAQLSAYSAAKVLVEGLKRAGKDISREKLIETLEGLNQYGTGLTPAITYGPNRRIGAMGAYVITIDLEKKEFVPASPWVNTN